MANSKNIIVEETEQELKNLIRQQSIHKKNRIQMLLILKKTQKSLSKIESPFAFLPKFERALYSPFKH